MAEAREVSTRNFPAHCCNRYGTLIEAEINLNVDQAKLLANNDADLISSFENQDMNTQQSKILDLRPLRVDEFSLLSKFLGVASEQNKHQTGSWEDLWQARIVSQFCKPSPS